MAQDVGQRVPWLQQATVYLDRRMLVILFLGFSSGLPLALAFSTLSVWLKEADVSKAEIGFFALVNLPYSLKFLWAPVLDGARLPWLTRRFGRRRGWALATQVGLIGTLLWLGSLDPTRQLLQMAWAALAVVTMAASQDVVIDAYRIEILEDDEQGAGGAMVQFGYRLGMLASGAGALFLSEAFPWSTVYAIEAAFVAVGMLTILACREPRATTVGEAAEESPVRPAGLGWLAEHVLRPFVDFMQRRGWLVLLVFIVLYKFGDAFVAVMANVFYKEMGFSNAEIASISKIFGTASTLIGIFVGGVIVHRVGVLRALFLCGLVQMLSNLMYVWMSVSGDSQAVFAVTIAIENVSGGMGGAAFVAYLSSLCSPGLAGTQYALLSSLGLISRTVLSAGTGWLAERVSWSVFFLVSTAVALPGMLLLLVLLRWERPSGPGPRADEGPTAITP